MQRTRPRPRRKAQDSRRAGLSCGRFGKLQRRQALFAKSQPLHCITSKRRIRNPSATPPRLPARSRCAARRPVGIVSDPPVRFPLIRSIGSIAFAWAPLLCPQALQPARLRLFMLAPPLEWGGRATASTRDRPDSSRNRRGAQTKSRSTRRRSLPRPPGINFRTEFEPRESNGAFGSPWRTLESHFSLPDNRFCAIKADTRGPRPGKRTSVESKEYEPKKEIKPKTPGPYSFRRGVRTPSKDPPPPPRRIGLF